MQALKEADFKRVVGFGKAVFAEMPTVLEAEYAQKHTEKGGRKAKLCVADILLPAIKYWRQYPTFMEPGLDFGVSATTAHDLTVWTENVLIKSGKFALSGKKKLLEENYFEVILVDVTENTIEKPKKTAKLLFRQEKEAHNQNPSRGRPQKRKDNLHIGSCRTGA